MLRAHRGACRRVSLERRRSHDPFLERLEPRIALSTFQVATEEQLRNAIAAADSNSDADNAIAVTANIALTETGEGQLVIDNTTSTPKTLIISGQSLGPPYTEIAGSSSWNSRIFEIVGTGKASVNVLIKDLEITGGKAHDGGVLGGNTAPGRWFPDRWRARDPQQRGRDLQLGDRRNRRHRRDREDRRRRGKRRQRRQRSWWRYLPGWRITDPE